jgi:hypothetical protein
MAASKEDPHAKGLALQLSCKLDCTTLLPVRMSEMHNRNAQENRNTSTQVVLSGLNRSVYVRSICYHPEKPMLAVVRQPIGL